MGGAVQVVMGPAGSGKSTYCRVMQEHCATLGGSRRRNVLVVNLDPAAETIHYQCAIDVRDLISVEDVMDELGLGPNGALMYCMEYLLQHLDWLREQMEPTGCGGTDPDEYWILDCPGQVELYTHVPIMRTILDQMQHQWGFGQHNMVGVFCIDATFCCDASKFISGQLLALSAMIALELPHINVLTKGDLLPEQDIEAMLNLQSASQLWEMEQDRVSLFNMGTRGSNNDLGNPYVVVDGWDDDRDDSDDEHDGEKQQSTHTRNTQQESQRAERKRQRQLEARRRLRHRLTDSICSLLDDYTMVSFVPLNVLEEDSIDHVLNTVDHAIQYGEDLEVRGAEGDDDIANPNDGDEDGGGD